MLFLISRSRSAVVAFARFTPLNSAHDSLWIVAFGIERRAQPGKGWETPPFPDRDDEPFAATLSLLGAAVGREVALVTKALRTVLAFLFFHAHDFVFRLRFTRVVTSHSKRHCRFSVLRLVVRLP